MCANGPASRSGSASGSGGLVDQGVLEVLPAQHRDQALADSSSPPAIRSSTTRSICSRSAATAASCRRWRRDASGSPSRCRAASSSGRSETVHAWASARCSARTSSGLSQGAHRRRYAGTDHRSPTRSVASISGHARSNASRRPRFCAQRRAEQVGRDVLVVDSGRSGSRAARPRSPSRASLCGVPGSGASNASAQSSALSQRSAQWVSTSIALGRRLLVEPDGRLDRLHQLRGRLQPRDRRIGLGSRRGSLGDEVAQGAGLHALLAEARQHVGDVGQVGLVRADEQHAAPAVAQPRVGVEQVGGAVQRDDGLAGARAAVDDERAARARADDRVLVGLDGARARRASGRAARCPGWR